MTTPSIRHLLSPSGFERPRGQDFEMGVLYIVGGNMSLDESERAGQDSARWYPQALLMRIRYPVCDAEMGAYEPTAQHPRRPAHGQASKQHSAQRLAGAILTPLLSVPITTKGTSWASANRRPSCTCLDSRRNVGRVLSVSSPGYTIPCTQSRSSLACHVLARRLPRKRCFPLDMSYLWACAPKPLLSSLATRNALHRPTPREVDVTSSTPHDGPYQSCGNRGKLFFGGTRSCRTACLGRLRPRATKGWKCPAHHSLASTLSFSLLLPRDLQFFASSNWSPLAGPLR